MDNQLTSDKASHLTSREVSPFHRSRRPLERAIFLTPALEGDEGSRPGRTVPREKPGTHFTGGWVSLSAGLDRFGKYRPPPNRDSIPYRPARRQSKK
jgi:hypothetical protein